MLDMDPELHATVPAAAPVEFSIIHIVRKNSCLEGNFQTTLQSKVVPPAKGIQRHNKTLKRGTAGVCIPSGSPVDKRPSAGKSIFFSLP
jgi:hypothetical protein